MPKKGSKKTSKTEWEPAQVGTPIAPLPFPAEVCLQVALQFCDHGVLNLGRLLLTSRAWFHLLNNESDMFQRKAKALGAKKRQAMSSWLATFVQKRTTSACVKCGTTDLYLVPYPLDPDEPIMSMICATCNELPAYKYCTFERAFEEYIRNALTGDEFASLRRPYPRGGDHDYWLYSDVEEFVAQKKERFDASLDAALAQFNESDQAELRPLIDACQEEQRALRASGFLKDTTLTCKSKRWSAITAKLRLVTVEDLAEMLALKQAYDRVKSDVEEAISGLEESEEYRNRLSALIDHHLKCWPNAILCPGYEAWHSLIATKQRTVDDFVAYLQRRLR